MQNYFNKFRQNIIGINQEFTSPYGQNLKIVYADWTASGRCYMPLEKKMQNELLPYVANTHTDTNTTGKSLTYAYHKAQHIIKNHVKANHDDVLISAGSGMTAVVNKLQRILGLRLHENFKNKITINDADRPVVFVTHMEHHSNQTSWLETIAEVKIIEPDNMGLVSLENLKFLLNQYKDRKIKIAAITACSNVTGIFTPYHEIAKIMHTANGLCFVDFACSAPYVNINMHPAEEGAHLDAIYFSPHKFLGGPGTSGILVFNKNLYHNNIPDNPGGGTVDWTNPWGQHKYLDNIEAREDGGTPPFLQTIRVAFCIKLKEQMGVENILKREKELMGILWSKLSGIKNLHILAGEQKERLGITSFYIENLHYNLAVKMLNDKFGIQSRGGCSCAGTYGHYLLNVTQDYSKQITDLISCGDNSQKPGWVRVSIHPTMTNEEIEFIGNSIQNLAQNYQSWLNDYSLNEISNTVEFKNKHADGFVTAYIDNCMDAELE